MPPKIIQDQPRIDPPTAPTENYSSTEERDEDLSSDEDLSDVEGIQTKLKETRAIHNEKLRRLVEENGPLPITFRKCDGRPTGEYAAMFATELGLAVRAFAPLQFEDWKHIPAERKRPIFDRMQNFFNVDFGTGRNSVKKETEIMMSSRYRNKRTKMHKYYKSLLHLSWEQRLKVMPEKYCSDKEDWKYMCNLFEDEKFKARSQKNADNRAQLPFNHCGGSKSFVQYSYEIGDGPAHVDRIALYKKTRYSSKKGWSHGAEPVYNKMVERREEIRQIKGKTNDGSHPLDEIGISSEACDDVLGKRSGYIKGLGNGPKPSKITSDDDSSRRATGAKLRQQLISTQNDLEKTRASLQKSEEKIEILEANQRMMMQIFQKIAPDVVQSMVAQTSSSAPSL